MDVPLQFTVTGPDDVIEALTDTEKILSKIGTVVFDTVGEVALFMQSIVHIDTGRLQKSIRAEYMANDSMRIVADAQNDQGEYYGAIENARGGGHAFADKGFDRLNDVLFDRVMTALQNVA